MARIRLERNGASLAIGPLQPDRPHIACSRRENQLVSKLPFAIEPSQTAAWRAQIRGQERAGLLASSNGARLKPHGVFVKARIEPAKWFLAPPDDVRSSDALEDAGTEFDVQGLELDWTCVCWDANYRRDAGDWQALQFKGTCW